MVCVGRDLKSHPIPANCAALRAESGDESIVVRCGRHSCKTLQNRSPGKYKTFSEAVVPPWLVLDPRGNTARRDCWIMSSLLKHHPVICILSPLSYIQLKLNLCLAKALIALTIGNVRFLSGLKLLQSSDQFWFCISPRPSRPLFTNEKKDLGSLFTCDY